MKIAKKTFLRGFTLIELMTAMAITAMLVVVIMQLTNQSVDLWKAVGEDVSTSSRARMALQTISHDFESFQMRGYDNKYQWLYARGDDTMDLPKGLQIPRSVQCVFFACAPDRNPSVSSSTSLRRNYREARAHNRDTQGDVNTIGYRLMYRDQIRNIGGAEGNDTGVFPLFSLYRQVVPPRPTFENLLGKNNLEAAYSTYALNDEQNFLCENILEMNITFNIRYAQGEADAKDGNVSYASVSVPVISSNSRTNKVSVYGNRIEAGSTVYQNARIDSAMVSISVLTEEGVTMVEQIRQGRRRAPKRIAEFFAKYTRSYSSMIALPQPL